MPEFDLEGLRAAAGRSGTLSTYWRSRIDGMLNEIERGRAIVKAARPLIELADPEADVPHRNALLCALRRAIEECDRA